jgi:hypothetical protein
MGRSLKVVLGPVDSDLGIARLVMRPDGTGRIEVFDESARVWRPSSNVRLTIGEQFDAPPVSPGLARRLGLVPPEHVSDLPPLPPLSPHHKGPIGPELKKIGDELVKAMVENLNYNVAHDIDPDASESERQAAYSAQQFAWLDLPTVVRPDTLRNIEQQLSLRGWQIADRWAAGAPAKVRRMQADGTLLARLKEQAALEARTISDARIGGCFSDVPDSELLAMNEIPILPAD